MKKTIKFCSLCTLIVFTFGFLKLFSNKLQLSNDLIRLHIVANSDSKADQEIKLQVRDAITGILDPEMQTFSSKKQAYEYIMENLNEIESIANQKLNELGVCEKAVVTLKQEEFPARDYETFSLPSGVYDSIRIEIGEASGENWWCVVFPTLCIPAAVPELQNQAVSSGFDSGLVKTLTKEPGYEIRFAILDFIGKVENFFFKG